MLRFRGESIHKVDQKGRVSLPASFRRVVEEGDPDWTPGAQASFVLVYGLVEQGCLIGYSRDKMQDLERLIEKMPYGRARKQLERAMLTRAMNVSVDDNGRFVLPAQVRQPFGIEGEAVFAGMNEKFEIWNPAAYDADMAELQSAGDEIGNPLEYLNQLQGGG